MFSQIILSLFVKKNPQTKSLNYKDCFKNYKIHTQEYIMQLVQHISIKKTMMNRSNTLKRVFKLLLISKFPIITWVLHIKHSNNWMRQ